MGKHRPRASSSGYLGGGGGADPLDAVAASSSSSATTTKHEQKLQAVLLADSFTSTFRPITLDSSTPKVLCPLNNITMLDYSIEFLAGAGVEELFIFVVNGAEEIQRYINQTTMTTKTSSSSGTSVVSTAKQKPQQQQQQPPWASSITIHCIRDVSCANVGDALRELDKRNVIQSDPFLLLSGDVITNVDIVPALLSHKSRHKRDSSAIMTVLFKRVGGWNVAGFDSDYGPNPEEEDTGKGETTPPTTPTTMLQYKASPLRSTTDDLIVGFDTTDPAGNRILLYDNKPSSHCTTIPCSFFTTHKRMELHSDMLDTGIYICSPDVLARFSDEFDYRSVSKFITNSAAEEEEGLQNKIYGHVLRGGEYAAVIHDPRTYHAVSRDLLRRWCYPVVPDNLPSGYEKIYRYVLGRHYVYKECREGGTKIGRSTMMKGPGMVGSKCKIGEGCCIEGTVIGNQCNIASGSTIRNSHLWKNVTIEENVSIIHSILCNDCTIKRGATIGRGCIIGRGCVIGENVTLADFTRITLCMGEDENDNEDDDGDEDESFSDSDSDDDDNDDAEERSEVGSFSEEETESGDTGSNDDDEEEEVFTESSKEYVKHKVVKTGHGHAAPVETDHDVVGVDGLGRVWIPSAIDDEEEGYDSDSTEDDTDGVRVNRAIEAMKAQSIGYNAASLYRKRMQMQEEDDDLFSDDGHGEGEEVMGTGHVDDIYGATSGFDTGDNIDLTVSSILTPFGQQKGVDVVRELKMHCLEHDKSNPVENLAIELNAYKFSQNATYSDCCTAVTLAILEIMNLESDTSPPKLATSLKHELEHWTPLYKKFCQGIDEERSILLALETSAVKGGTIGEVLSREPAFRFILQLLHDEEIVNEEAILSWATERSEGDLENAKGKLFMQQPTQDFLEWLQEESESESESEGEVEDEDDCSDEDE